MYFLKKASAKYHKVEQCRADGQAKKTKPLRSLRCSAKNRRKIIRGENERAEKLRMPQTPLGR